MKSKTGCTPENHLMRRLTTATLALAKATLAGMTGTARASGLSPEKADAVRDVAGRARVGEQDQRAAYERERSNPDSLEGRAFEDAKTVCAVQKAWGRSEKKPPAVQVRTMVPEMQQAARDGCHAAYAERQVD